MAHSMGIVSSLNMTHLARKKTKDFQQLSKSKGSGTNWYQIENKTSYIPKVGKCYVEKKCRCEQN